MEKIKIYSVTHSGLEEETLVQGESLEDAVEKFKRFYCDDTDICYHGSITSVNLKYEFNCIV